MRKFSMVLIVLVILAWAWISRKGSDVPKAPGEPSVLESSGIPAAPSPAVPADAIAPGVQPSAVASRRSEAPLRDVLPTREAYREEGHKNPHAVPRPVQDFATRMGERMEFAMQDENAAKRLLPELADCVTDAEVKTVRQMCLINARRLKARHPSLGSEAARVDEAASNDLKQSLKEVGF